MNQGFWAVLGLAGLVFGLWQAFQRRRTIRRLDRMLSDAIQGGFRETTFDESALSALESKMAQFLSGSARDAQLLAQNQAAVQSLISDISHQTKTPTANILLYASLLAESGLTPAQAEQAHALTQQAEKLAFLTQALVKASQLETGIISLSPALHQVQQLLEQAAAQVQQAAQDKQIQIHLQPCSGRALFDLRWTAEALCNVLENGVKYSPPGSRIRLSATRLDSFCRIDVADQGPGIPQQEQAKIFQRFYRGPAAQGQPGLGIGLFLSRQILSRQGGFIKVASPGQGAVFSLYLPLQPMNTGKGVPQWDSGQFKP